MTHGALGSPLGGLSLSPEVAQQHGGGFIDLARHIIAMRAVDAASHEIASPASRYTCLRRLSGARFPSLDRAAGGIRSRAPTNPIDNQTPAVEKASMSGTATQTMAWKIDGTHVYPVNDLREHSVTNCWCGPVDDDGIMVHNSLDGRELYERGERQIS